MKLTRLLADPATPGMELYRSRAGLNDGMLCGDEGDWFDVRLVNPTAIGLAAG
jgi:hypothetical protein